MDNNRSTLSVFIEGNDHSEHITISKIRNELAVGFEQNEMISSSVIWAFEKSTASAYQLAELLRMYGADDAFGFKARNHAKYLNRLYYVCSLIESHNAYIAWAIMYNNSSTLTDDFFITVDGNVFIYEKKLFRHIFDKLFAIADVEMRAAMLEYKHKYLDCRTFEEEMTL